MVMFLSTAARTVPFFFSSSPRREVLMRRSDRLLFSVQFGHCYFVPFPALTLLLYYACPNRFINYGAVNVLFSEHLQVPTN